MATVQTTTTTTRRVDDNPPQQPSSSANLWGIIHLVLAIFALYLSFLCNNGFNILSFLAALFCPYLYIPYVLARKASDQGFCPQQIFGSY